MVRKKKTDFTVIAVVLVVLLFAVLLMSALVPKNSWVSPAWEIYNQVGALRHNSQNYVDPADFTMPCDLMGVYWKVDIDDPDWGVATMMCEVSDIVHVDFSGMVTPWDQPASERVVTRGNHTYNLDYHIYKYTITIRTVADKEPHAQIGLPPYWSHETSWTAQYGDPLGHKTVTNPPEIGEEFNGGFYTKFVILPWRGVGYQDPPPDPPDGWYVLEDCWAGVMNTYVLDKTQGQVENQWGDEPTPVDIAPMRITGGLDEGHQVPMFQDDGSFGTPAPVVEWGGATPDTRIESTVVHYLPIQLFAGAGLHYNFIGQTDDLYPCDVAVQYTIRVDVLQTHDFALQTAQDPPDPDFPHDWFTWAYDFWEVLLGNLNPFGVFGIWGGFVAFLFLIALVIFAVIVILAVFRPKSVHTLAEATRKLAKGKSEKTA